MGETLIKRKGGLSTKSLANQNFVSNLVPSVQ